MYMGTVYRSSKTVLEISRERSQPITGLRGVRQGDPLSYLLFFMVMDHVLKRLDSEVGYTIQEIKINGLAYADDIVLYASTVELKKYKITTEQLFTIGGWPIKQLGPTEGIRNWNSA